MLDLKFIEENADAVKENCIRRKVDVRIVDAIIEENRKRKEAIQERDALIHERKQSKVKPDDTIIQRVREIGRKIDGLKGDIESCEKTIEHGLKIIPNLTSFYTGDEPVVIKQFPVKEFSFGVKDHIKLGESLDIIDFDAGRTIGNKFYYLKNDGVLLEHALTSFVLDIFATRGFDLYQTPDLAPASIVEKMGFFPRGISSQIYNIECDSLCLIGTSEITLGALQIDKVIDSKKLPIRCVGISHCFRKEAGSYGKENKGLYRVHQFSKVEMFVFCHPRQSDDILGELVSIQEEIYTKLEIPYRVVEIPAHDLGNPAYRKIDLEAWMPGRNDWGEITSASNCLDYQSRRCNTKYLDGKEKSLVHTLNATAIAIPRTIIAILENHQHKNGCICVPKALEKYMNKKFILPRR